ncbi:MAG: peptidyl-prolyl cis-trans isomerase [Gammaproteobacteria bacterium]|nr:peptidyl-prolyl cis-trans isomerase [Gammaproteobacteria bacterium]
MPQASARHILVDTEENCQSLIDEINGGADFAELAKQHSKCPSGREGGNLGSFGPGQMVPEFDQAVFNGNIGDVQGPVKTDFGFHILQVTERTD